MAEDWAAVATETLEALASVGYVLPVTRSVYAAPDSETPWVPGSDTPETFNVTVLSEEYMAEEIDGTTILKGDKKFIIGAGTYVPQIGDEFTEGGLPYRIMDIDRLAPGGVALLYTVQVRG